MNAESPYTQEDYNRDVKYLLNKFEKESAINFDAAKKTYIRESY